jgi:hypothetical protein
VSGLQGRRERDCSAVAFADAYWDHDHGITAYAMGIENAGTGTAAAAQTEQNRPYEPNTCRIDAYIHGPPAVALPAHPSKTGLVSPRTSRSSLSLLSSSSPVIWQWGCAHPPTRLPSSPPFALAGDGAAASLSGGATAAPACASQAAARLAQCRSSCALARQQRGGLLAHAHRPWHGRLLVRRRCSSSTHARA